MLSGDDPIAFGAAESVDGNAAAAAERGVNTPAADHLAMADGESALQHHEHPGTTDISWVAAGQRECVDGGATWYQGYSAEVHGHAAMRVVLAAGGPDGHQSVSDEIPAMRYVRNRVYGVGEQAGSPLQRTTVVVTIPGWKLCYEYRCNPQSREAVAQVAALPGNAAAIRFSADEAGKPAITLDGLATYSAPPTGARADGQGRPVTESVASDGTRTVSLADHRGSASFEFGADATIAMSYSAGPGLVKCVLGPAGAVSVDVPGAGTVLRDQAGPLAMPWPTDA